MKPILLTMQAFGSYGRKTVIDFTKPCQNLFLITGNTGSGKTTIFDALVFALYGQASSGANKKDGMELQSQFTSLGTEPYVELTFSEHSHGREERYTVRRSPRHERPLLRGSGKKPVVESVSLLLPDGTEFSQNRAETDAKLEEIVGLTKSQFMQVAMIAQGEFMELLRADSNKKKEIFRKLFGTGLFQDVVWELERRKKEKYAQMGDLLTACKTEAGHIRIPETLPRAEQLTQARQQIMAATVLRAPEMEQLMQELEDACNVLKSRKKAAEEAFQKASKLRDERRDAFSRGQALNRAFLQLEQARQTLEACRGAEPEMEQLRQRIQKIDAAYEIQHLYRRWADARKTGEETEKQLQTWETALPELQEARKTAGEKAAEARILQEKGLKHSAEISQQANRALALFEQISAGEKAVLSAQTHAREAEEDAQDARRQLEAFASEQQRQTELLQQLEGTGEALMGCSGEIREAESLRQALEEGKKLEQEAESRVRAAEKARQEYLAASVLAENTRREYEETRRAFLDAQAGFLASELTDGQPCPVCGSVHHPSPCRLSPDHRGLTREAVEALAAKSQRLQELQAEAAESSGSAGKLAEEKKHQLSGALEKLKSSLEPMGISGEADLFRWESELSDRISNLQRRERKLKADAENARKIREFLQKAQDKTQALQEVLTSAEKAAAEKKANLAGEQAKLEALRQQKEYPDRQAAEAALAAAKQEKKHADEAAQAAGEAERQAVSAAAHAAALIQQFRQELPGQKEALRQREAEYQAILEEKELAEDQWMALRDEYPRQRADALRQQLDSHMQAKAAAAGAAESAEKAVGDSPKPDLEQLEALQAEAQEALTAADAQLQEGKVCLDADWGVFRALAPKMEERSRVAEEYAKIDSLYSRLAGKVSGARMDIETYVQRCYLRQILIAANARFQDMSAGQFQLRMVSQELAGDGKNRGLDLMVYSTVTGKEREVRTLSGGESFMAALSLALGMADQIQENSSAIHLDMMFIDEGFGSLDAHSRDQAVRVLQQMAGGNKLIGIISHVTELQTTIDDQLLVTKDESGSHVRWAGGQWPLTISR